MINVVGAGEDPENLKPATLYNFSSTAKKAPEPVKPVSKPEAAVVAATPAAAPATTLPPTIKPPAAPIPEPLPTQTPPTIQPPIPPKSKKTSSNLIIAGLIGLIILVGGGAAALYLGQTSQDVRQQASTFTAPENRTPTSPAPEPTVPPTVPLDQTDEVDQLALGPTLTPTPIPTQTPSPTETPTDTLQFCNQSCVTDENCENLSHTCISGACRLTSNPTNNRCQTPSGGSQVVLTATQNQRIYSAYAVPAGETPQSGPADWLHYFWIGVGALGLGGVFLLLL